MSLTSTLQVQVRAHGEAGASLDVYTGAPGDLWGRIACALGVHRGLVALETSRLNPDGYGVRCVGRFRDKKFFAKIFLYPFHPVPPRFLAPWKRWGEDGGRARRVCEEIETEWNMTHRLRGLPVGEQVPEPLGKSCASKTIVWEEAPGERLDRLVKWSRLSDPKGESIRRALFEAGRWLRRLHGATYYGTQFLDASTALENLENAAPGKRGGGRIYIQTAREIVERFVAQSGLSRFRVPLALTHGDFCLSNLLWERKRRRLAVVDFELCDIQPACQDLFSLVSDLRAQLLIPWIPKRAVEVWEESFWNGYGAVPPEVRRLIGVLALARVYYHHFPRLLTRRKRRGWFAGVTAGAYRMLAEKYVINHRLSTFEEPALGTQT